MTVQVTQVCCYNSWHESKATVLLPICHGSLRYLVALHGKDKWLTVVTIRMAIPISPKRRPSIAKKRVQKNIICIKWHL